MATFNLLLNSKPKKDSTYSILLRVTENRKHKYMTLQYSVPKKDWNPDPKPNNAGVLQYVRKSHIHHKQINDYLDTKIKEAKRRIEEIDSSSADVIMKAVKGGNRESFIDFSEQVIRNIGKNPTGFATWKRYRSIIKKLKTYLKGKDLTFDEITYEFLDAYRAHLYSIGNHKNTVSANLKTIRAILYRAIKAGKFEQAKNPFFRFELENQRTQKEALTANELEQIIQLDLNRDRLIWHVRNYLLLSFYLHGIRISDFMQLKYKNLQEGRIVYRMGKTNEVASIKLHPKAIEILSHYLKEDAEQDDFIFPILDNDLDYSDYKFLSKQISAKTALINKYLKMIAAKAGINKNISSHTARRTFASTARDKIGDISKIQKMLGHSDIKITQAYLQSLTDHSIDVETDRIYGDE